MAISKTEFDFASYIEQFRLANECESLEEINNGLCGDFAFLLNEELERQGLPTFDIMTLFNFSTDLDFPENTAKWSLQKLEACGVPEDAYKAFLEQLSPRDGQDSDDPDLYVGYHIWLYDGEKHYDCENMAGVANPLELPFFKRQQKG